MGFLVQRPLGRAVLVTLLALTSTAAAGFFLFLGFSCWGVKDACQPEMSIATAGWLGLLALLVLLMIAALTQGVRKGRGDKAATVRRCGRAVGRSPRATGAPGPRRPRLLHRELRPQRIVV